MSKSKSAPELPADDKDRVFDADEVISLDDKIDGPIDDKLTELLEEVEEVVPDADLPKADSEEPAENPESPQIEDSIPNDPAIDEAIDDIVAKESDALLEAEDDAKEAQITPLKPAKPESKIGAFFKALWLNPKSRWALIGGFTVLALALTLFPTSRYFILNTARVRSSVEIKVIDSGTLQPLKNVSVRAGGANAQTNSDGVAKLEGARLGRTKLIIEKRAFEQHERTITIGWGSNPLGEFRAEAVGVQYTFFVTDGLNGKPIERAEAASGEGNASSDKDGKIVLTMDTADQDDAAQISIQISADKYRTETLNITVNNKSEQKVSMMPSHKHVFVSKRSGNYDLYTVDVDGKNEKRLKGGSGYERDDLALVPHPTEDYTAFVATRENTRNQNGYLLSTLYIVDTNTGDMMKTDQSEQIQIIGWSRSGRLIYVKVAAGASGTDPKRHRLISFNNEDHSDTKELASSNSFNDVLMADDKVYYAPSNVFQEDTAPATYVINPDGSNQKPILDKEVFAIVRSAFDTVHLSAGQDWFTYVHGADKAETAQPPVSQNSRVYIDSPDGSSSIWVDNRDGKGVVIRYDKSTKTETELVSRGGIKLPVYWLNSKNIVYRLADGRETADYILNIEGGDARKIIDVTDTTGIARWFYF